MTENKLPNVWDKAETNHIPDGSLWFTPDDPDKLKVMVNQKWEKIDPYKDLEERKVKKTEETND